MKSGSNKILVYCPQVRLKFLRPGSFAKPLTKYPNPVLLNFQWFGKFNFTLCKEGWRPWLRFCKPISEIFLQLWKIILGCSRLIFYSSKFKSRLFKEGRMRMPCISSFIASSQIPEQLSINEKFAKFIRAYCLKFKQRVSRQVKVFKTWPSPSSPSFEMPLILEFIKIILFKNSLITRYN